MNNENKRVEFIPSGRGKAKCEPNPNFPHGIEIVCPPNTPVSCKVALPYPAPECGMWSVVCTTCQCRLFVTAAGRPDDPVSVFLPCRISESIGHA
jgi:hypothetical protein